MTEEPYRWLEAISNRREYIEDQLAPGLPVVAISGEAGVLLLTTKSSMPKLFEIYDHLALGCLGHPADIERVRQSAIDAAHVEGFTRSPIDVSARRLVSYNLAPALKTAFEQIFAAPLLFRGLLAELGATPEHDWLWRLDYDGSFSGLTGPELAQGALISGPRQVAKDWQEHRAGVNLERGDLKSAARSALRLLLWAKRRTGQDGALPFSEVTEDSAELKKQLGTERFEVGLLDRRLIGQTIAYREPSAEELGL